MNKISIINSEEIYNRIRQNKPFDKSLKIYTKKEIEASINFFLLYEEYEKCDELKKFIEKRFNHKLNFNFKTYP